VLPCRTPLSLAPPVVGELSPQRHYSRRLWLDAGLHADLRVGRNMSTELPPQREVMINHDLLIS